MKKDDIIGFILLHNLFVMIGIKQTIEEALKEKVDIIRLRDKMNGFLRQRIERDVIYV